MYPFVHSLVSYDCQILKELRTNWCLWTAGIISHHTESCHWK